MSMSVVMPMSVRMFMRVGVARPFMSMGMHVHRFYSTSFAAPPQPLHFHLLLDG
jgi:hypothetical protein